MRLAALAELLHARYRASFSGTISAWPAAILRVGVALIVLVRTSDFGRSFIRLDHHGWVQGLEYHPNVEQLVEPALRTPLLAFLPPIGDGLATILVYARTALAFALLLGAFPRFSAGALALVGYVVMAADRYRYLHHLHLLWVMCAWLAVLPSDEKLSASWVLRRATLSADRRSLVTRLLQRREPVEAVPRWSIQLVRFQALIIYAASGIAKLTPGWLDGSTLHLIERIGLVRGSLFKGALAIGSYQSLSIVILLTELALPLLLAGRKTRLFGVGLGLALHAGFSAALVVSTFGAQMALFLMLFLPWNESWPGRSAAVQVDAESRAPR